MDYKTSTKLNEEQGKEVWVDCAGCDNATKHEVLFSVGLHHDSEDIQARESYQIVRCRGCETVSFRLVSSNSEDFDYSADGYIDYLERKEVYPPRIAGRSKLKAAHEVKRHSLSDLGTAAFDVAENLLQNVYIAREGLPAGEAEL